MVWVPLALGKDVPTGITRAVIVETAELVVWRSASGAVQVWEDRCPHRGMRLSFGFVRGEALNCLYHGWQYGADARCMKIPAHPDLTVPPSIKANAFPAVERGHLIWTQQGPGSDAPPSLPDAHPVASLAVEAPIAAILSLCAAAPRGDAQIFAADLDRMTFYIGWHAVDAGKSMLHASVVGDADPLAALVALRSLRQRAEIRAAA